jgi:ribosome-binding factor A
MSTRAKNKNLTKVIFNLLVNNEDLRDDWISTIRMVHDIEMSINGIIQQDYYYAIFYTNKLSNVQTIKRVWQMIQESRADLRGNSWEERQKQGGMIAKEMVFIDPKQLKMFDE